MSTRISLAALALALAAALAAAPAQAAMRWNDGTPAQSTLFNCVLEIPEAGALAYAGYQADPSNLPRPGQVFYGHAVFGAAMEACAGDQFGELDVVLPPGVRLAIDAAHPLRCFYEDNGGPVLANPTCPTRALNGVYGPRLPAGDGGAPWDMPAGRLLEVQFPLVSNRQLRGPAGGHCPQSLGELQAYPHHDCLITALHLADGSTDPWLVPDEELVTAAAPAAPAPAPRPKPQSGAPGPKRPARPGLRAPRQMRIRTLMAHGMRVTLVLPRRVSSATVSLRQGRRTLARARRRHLRAGRWTVRLRLSRTARRRLRHVRRARLSVVAQLSRPTVTLRAPLTARR
jgi:hypothetical protein